MEVIVVIRINQIKIDINKDNEDNLYRKCASKLGINRDSIKKIIVLKKSIDARHKPNLFFSYVVAVELDNVDYVLRKCRHNKDISIYISSDYKVNITGDKMMLNRPVIVGSGPCGLILGYMLSLYGYKPIIVERGKMVDDRVEDVKRFWETGQLNVNSNIQFGEGGAGTFSDGKLNTLVKDKYNRINHIFKIFVENGAPSEILYENKPHIGSDNLRMMVKNIRNKIIDNGGEFRFNTTLTDINYSDNGIQSIVLNDNLVIDTDVLVLAIGHSARDTIKMLDKRSIDMESKPFAVGVRIQHSQDMINSCQYGDVSHSNLKNASYKLTYKSKSGRGVYSFCMCPGGYVVNASSEKGMLCVNGMSNYNRDSGNANSAIVVTVDSRDYGNNLFDGMEFQRELEKKAYDLGKGKIPVSLFKDYYNNTISDKFGEIKPVFKGNYKFANINVLFPDYINDSIKEGINFFNTKINGFSDGDAIIAGPEARTSSPIRILRDSNCESNIKGIYPAGEGAGYAGGITSAAIDGLIVFEKIIKKYKPNFF